MRWIYSAIVAMCCLGLIRGAAADEPVAQERPGHAGVDSAKSNALGAAFHALTVRMEAEVRRAELLATAGRTDEALATYEGVGALWDDGVATIRSLMAQAPAAPRPPTRVLRPIPAAPRTVRAPQFRRASAKGAEAAVEEALRWLKAHQSPGGSWDAANFGAWCDGKTQAANRPDGSGKASYTPGVTGLALTAFLSAGYTQRGEHSFAETINQGLRYLKNIQDPEGCIGTRTNPNFIYNHAMGTIALVEAYAMTASPILHGAAQRALDFSQMARNPYFGWRYGVKPGDNDTSVTHWMLLGIYAAKQVNEQAKADGRPAPFAIDDGAFTGAFAWVEKMTDPDYGRVGYISRGTGPARPQALIDRFPGEKSEAMTGAGIHIRLMTGEDPDKSPLIQKGADLLDRLPPVWNPVDGSIDMYYWYVGTVALAKVGGKHWRPWGRKLLKALIPTQRGDTDYCGYKGSWDPIGPWGPDGGRVYSTALMAMTLSAWARASKTGVRSR